jgi:hypothetical protein
MWFNILAVVVALNVMATIFLWQAAADLKRSKESSLLHCSIASRSRHGISRPKPLAKKLVRLSRTKIGGSSETLRTSQRS